MTAGFALNVKYINFEKNGFMTFLKIIRKSRFLSIVFGASIFTLGNMLSWIAGFTSEPTAFDFVCDPIAGGFIGYIGYYGNKINEKIKAEEAVKKNKEEN